MCGDRRPRPGDLQELAAARPGKTNVLTHCNAGWLATVDWGTPLRRSTRPTALASIFMSGSMTRPRNQGASLTAYEFGCEGVLHRHRR